MNTLPALPILSLAFVSSFGHILLCYILPFLAVNLAIFFIVTATPKIEMTISDTTDYKTLDVSFKVHSLLPLKKMTTTLESQPIEFQKEKGVYHAVLTNNGTLEVYVLSSNILLYWTIHRLPLMKKVL